jgi:DNA-binding NarL/FixJ family response regulator
LRRLFESNGWDVCLDAVNGQDAVDKALQFKPHVIILDLSMPLMNGLTAACILTELVPESRLILFSALATLLSSEQLSQSGFAAVISKEHPGTLLDAAQKLCEAA